MGIFGALTTSVAGLRAQSYALENISGNIANSQTTAFKRIDTSFLDLIPDTGVNNQLAGSVTTASRETNTVQGDVQTASVSTYMAINGNGFFVVQKPGSFSDNQPVFSGVDNYTRRGDFALDKNGYLVNGAGYYVEGVPIDPATGNMTGSVPQVLKFANDFLPAVPTSVDFASGNPRSLGTPATPYGDATTTGASKNNKATTPAQISTSTLLNGGAGTNSLTTNFVLGDTITVDGTAITIVSTPTNLATNEINLTTGTIQDLLTNIGAITGVAPTISGGAITLHTGTASTLTVATNNTNALGALGLTALTLPRTGGGTAGTGQVLGSDLQAAATPIPGTCSTRSTPAPPVPMSPGRTSIPTSLSHRTAR